MYPKPEHVLFSLNSTLKMKAASTSKCRQQILMPLSAKNPKQKQHQQQLKIKVITTLRSNTTYILDQIHNPMQLIEKISCAQIKFYYSLD